MTIPSEHLEQVAFVRWFRASFPGVMIFAIPNGDLRNVTTAKRLKDEGQVNGIPDLYIPAWKIWIEMKRKKGGRLSPDQKEKIAYLESIGDTVIVGYGCDDARAKLLDIIKK